MKRRWARIVGGQIVDLTPPTLAEITVQPGQLRRSIGPVTGYQPTEGEFFIPINRTVRSLGAVVSFNGDGEAIRVGDRVHDHRRYERARAESCGQTDPHLGRTPAEAAENLRIRLGHCPHGLAEEVVLCTGEIVAAVCPTCLEVLPASFVGSHWKP